MITASGVHTARLQVRSDSQTGPHLSWDSSADEVSCALDSDIHDTNIFNKSPSHFRFSTTSQHVGPTVT